MALVTKLISGFYIDGTCEVYAVYNDATHLLKEIIVKGDMDRVVDVTVNGETVEIEKHNLEELKFSHSKRNIRYFVSPDDTKNDIPSIICTYYAQKMSRNDVEASK